LILIYPKRGPFTGDRGNLQNTPDLGLAVRALAVRLAATDHREHRRFTRHRHVEVPEDDLLEDVLSGDLVAKRDKSFCDLGQRALHVVA
jgi:hypothetical protein